MPISFDNLIVFSAGGIVGTLAGLLIEHRLSRSRSIDIIRITEFNKAAAVFRTAFVNEIFMLRKNVINGDTFISNIITDSTYIRHEKAKIIFEPYLIESNLERFNTTWEDYKYCENKFFSRPQSYHPASITNRKEFSQFYLEHIYNLLNYAKPTSHH